MSVENEHPNPGEQGRAAHSTGSTSQGGSNFGQGSSHLGGESYQQGSESGKGANYENETEKLGSSTTGTNEEGASSPGAGGGMTQQPKGRVDKNTERGNPGWDGKTEDTANGSEESDSHDTKKLFEGDEKSTSLEQASGMEEDQDQDKKSEGSQSRGWSAGSAGS